MTLNDVMAFNLHYFAEFGSFRGALRKRGWQNHNYGQFTITKSSSKRLQRDRATLTYKGVRRISFQGEAKAHRAFAALSLPPFLPSPPLPL